MSAIVEPVSSSQDALPVCLGGENPHRLVSLWDIVNHFNVHALYVLLRQIELFEGQYETAGARELTKEELENAYKTLAFARDELKVARFQDLSNRANRSLISIPHSPKKYCASMAVYFRQLRDDIEGQLIERKFLWVAPEYADYLEPEPDLSKTSQHTAPCLFGPMVNDSFPSATADIKEAGNCLAAGCGTATVFHLMRASEFALRSLARDRDVDFKDKPLDEKEWGQILDALESKVAILRQSGRKLWTLPKARDVQIRYYNELVQEFRTFNEAWRRHIAHADIHAFYEPRDAFGIFAHVRTFMQKLSEKISETSVTLQYWDSL